MTQRLTAAVKAVRHLRGERVLCLPDGSPITRDCVIKAVRGAQRIAGIEQGVHILRHTFCSAFARRATADKSRSITPAPSNERAEASEPSEMGGDQATVHWELEKRTSDRERATGAERGSQGPPRATV